MKFEYYIKRAKEKITNKIIRTIFHYQTKEVFDIPKIGRFSSESPVALLSMLQESDVQMYLLAVKSLLRYLTINKVVIVCDPSLSNDSREKIKAHIAHVDFLEATNFMHESIPIGGTWERLHAISHLTDKYYVIQMDADILFMHSPSEVIQAIKHNSPFILGTNRLYQQLTLQQMTDIVLQWIKQYKMDHKQPHIQMIAEINMQRLAEPLGYASYTRGCSGFAGFSKGSITPEGLTALSQVFYADLGEKWKIWGTEQFMSNLLLSNLKNIEVLPVDKYNSSEQYEEGFVMAHFIGTWRFYNLLYTKIAKMIICEIDKEKT